jgi:dihydroflavonol-4-reductase
VAQGIESTRRVLEVLRRAEPERLVFTSSASTIRPIAGRLATEEDAEPWPLTHWRPLYPTVKVAIEHEALAAQRAGLPVVVVNPTVCLGEYDARPFSGLAILAFARYRVPVYLDQTFNAVYTGDVGVGHLRAAERGRAGQRYLLACRNLDVKTFAGIVAEAAHVPAPRWRLPYHLAVAAAAMTECAAWLTRSEPWLPRQAVHPRYSGQQLDNSLAVRELGLPQTPVETAVRRAVDWFKQHHYL